MKTLILPVKIGPLKLNKEYLDGTEQLRLYCLELVLTHVYDDPLVNAEKFYNYISKGVVDARDH